MNGEAPNNAPNTEVPQLRDDLRLIANMVKSGSRVLDVGCGDGALLDYLSAAKDVDGRGIELSQNGVNACVAKGLAVIQGDANTDLGDYPTNAFDYVILSQTLQAVHRPRDVIVEMLRIGRHGIVSFPNFGFWRVRWYLALYGRMPVTPTLDEPWYQTPNIHLCTIRDFTALCRDLDLDVEQAVTVRHDGNAIRFQKSLALANLLGAQGVFLIKGRG